MATMNTTTGIVYVKGVSGSLFINSGGLSVGTSATNTDGVIVQSSGSYKWNTRSGISSPSDGVINLTNAAGTDFNRLQFGGTTSSFPAIKRSSNILEAKLADDSGYAFFRGNFMSSSSNPADSGSYRLANTDTIAWRNNANTANVTLTVTSSDVITGNAAIASTSVLVAASATATPAGGSTGCGLQIGSSAVGHYIGTGAPTLSAAKGSIYVRTDATTTTTRLYINTDGGTTWTNFTSAA